MKPIGNRGLTLIVGLLMAATALLAYNAPLSGNEKVTIAFAGVLVSLVVADLLKRRIYGTSRPEQLAFEPRGGDAPED